MSGQMLYVVGKLVEGKQWELCGIYDLESDAVARCDDPMHFVGPFERNHWVDGDQQPWCGAYFPVAKAEAAP